MAQRRTTLIYPPIEDLLDKVDSKFTLVSLSAKRARQINSYYNQLGEGMGVVVPPQVASVSGKPLTIAFEEIASAKATYHHPDPEAEVSGEEAFSDVAAAVSSSHAVSVDDGAATADAPTQSPADALATTVTGDEPGTETGE